MTNTLRSVAALLAWPVIVAAMLSGCSPAQATHLARIAAPAVVAAQVNVVASGDITAVAQAISEELCSAHAERDSDLWWDCVVEENTRQCEAQGWCE